LNKKNLSDERKRIEFIKRYEYQAQREGYQYIAGIDEVGRGCIAGPVVAAAVILPFDSFIPEVDDSKKLSPKKRVKLAGQIKEEAVSWAAASVFPPFLDRINILNATKVAMGLAIKQLSPLPDYLLIDAVKLNDINIKQNSLVKGDSLSISIACASIIAKVERDKSMEAFAGIYPAYGFARHKGYATRAHIEALFKEGVCPIHRESFEPVKSMLTGGRYGEQSSLFE
jgi:ribonuclease HII